MLSLFDMVSVAYAEPYMVASAGNYTYSVSTQWGQSFRTHDAIGLLDKVELMASQVVMIEADPDFFEPLSPALLLSLARRIDVLDPSSRPLVQKEAISILENDVRRMQQNENSFLDADLAELRSALQYARQQYVIENNLAADSQLQAFSEEVSSTEDVNRQAGSNGELTLGAAAELLEKRGINPYHKEARRYYCEMGFTGLDTMGVHYVAFCPTQAALGSI